MSAMSLDLADASLAPLVGRLGPYARNLLEAAGRHALRIHAEFVTPDHLLSTLMADEACGAHAAVLHAFADPSTIAEEALAISPGWMVVASGSTLPFSARAADALASAAARAASDCAEDVRLSDLRMASEAALDDEVRTALRAAGYVETLLPAEGLPAEGRKPSFPASRRFTPAAKRALSAANRLAASERAASISPAHLFLAALLEDPGEAAAAGLAFARARSLLAGRTKDTSEPPERLLPPDPSLVRFLADLPASAGSLDLLRRFHGGATPELSAILDRSKVNAAYLDRARGAFGDPD
jgi:ATP-dependent Clp protease ATP-binding subunit ClpA